MLAMAHASLQALASTVLHPALMLATIAFLLGGSFQQVAWFAVVSIAAWSFTPLLLQLLLTMTTRTPLIILVSIVLQAGAIFALGLTAYRLDDWTSSTSLSMLIVSYAVIQVTLSINIQLGRADAAMISAGRNPGRRLGLRNVWLLATAGIAGWAAWSQLKADVPLEESLKNLLLLAAIALGSAVLLRSLIPGPRSASRAPSSLKVVSAFGTAARSSAFRRIASYRILLALVAAADPFLIVYGLQQMQLEVRYVGLAVLAWAGGQAIGQLIWPRLVQQIGSRVPLQIATMLRLVLLVLVVSLPELVTSSAYTDRFDGPEIAMTAFALAFVLLGVATSAGNTANQRYLMDISRPGDVAGITTMMNSLAGVFAFAPLGVAWALNRYDMDRIFWGLIAAAVVTLLASGLLPGVRVRLKPSSGSWRRRATSQPA